MSEKCESVDVPAEKKEKTAPTENSTEKENEQPPETEPERKPQEKKSGGGKSLGGLGRIFNSNTTAGRANVAKATYAGIFLTYLYFRFRKGKKPPPDKGKDPSENNEEGDHHASKDTGTNTKESNDHFENKSQDRLDSGDDHHILPSETSSNDTKWQKRSITKKKDSVPSYKTEIRFASEMIEVPKSLPESKVNSPKESDGEQIRESTALNTLKRRISQNPRYMDP